MTTVGVLEQTPFVKDSAIERTSFNRGDYAGDVNAIQGYTAGARKEITYFNQVAPAVGNRTNTIDASTTRSLTQVRYTQIENLELIFPDAQLDFDWDADLTEATVGGKALVYPVVVPLVADQFLFPIGDGRLGVFQVSGVRPLSMRASRFHEITFYLTRVASEADVQLLYSAATKTVIFDKPLNVANGMGVMLEQTGYRTLQQLRQMREVLARYYFSNFYVREVSSYCRPVQLQPGVDAAYPDTIWGRFADRMTLSLDGLYTNHVKRVQINTYVDVGITPLLNRFYVAMTGTPADDAIPSPFDLGYYVFSQAFYDNDAAHQTALEELTVESILTRRIADPAALLTGHVNLYRQGTPDEQFYKIPVYLHLIDVALASYVQMT